MLSKGSALYVFRPEVADYVCGKCVFAKTISAGERCAYFGPTKPISFDRGSCGLWTHSDPKNGGIEIPWLSLYTPEQVGYAESKHGFGCRRCSEFLLGKDDCERVDKKSVGDTPGTISPYACCAEWEPDEKRAGMTNQELVKILERPKVTLRTAKV